MVRSIEDEVIKMRAELEEADDKALRARNIGDRDKWILWLRESQQLRGKMLQLMGEQVAAQPGAYLRASPQPAMQKPGIGKGLFLCYLMWELARLKRTFIYEKRDAETLVLFTPTGVFEGPLTAFRAELDDAQTWYLVDGHMPMVVKAKTVLVTPPDWDVWKDTIKRADCIWRYMPTWDPEEIETARQCIINSQPKTEVDDRLKRWGDATGM
ncbi:g4032 [Coccomyxa viridis]|uniref:G4032 protein n=1 Tax=Coccomyxa viridis TaxID=1274662 RepID=A0ABP1FSH5_9CHLO